MPVNVQVGQVLYEAHPFNATSPPASLTLRSLSLLFLTTFSISHPNAQHHASRSTLLLVLNTISL